MVVLILVLGFWIGWVSYCIVFVKGAGVLMSLGCGRFIESCIIFILG
jgi:hypothetical protein